MTEEKEVAETNGQNNKDESAKGVVDSVLEAAIIRQVEYYFGDINLPRDKFLREQIQLDDGWVPFDVLTRFHRLANLSSDTEVICKALQNSVSGLLEISDDMKKVRRNPERPVPEMNEERRKELASRTIYAKGFPKDSTLDELLNYFKQYEEVENLIMRRYQDKNTKQKLFKGSVFVVFKTKEQAEKFYSLDNVKYKDELLLILWQEDYNKKKQEEYASKKQNKDKTKEKKTDNPVQKEEFKLPTGTVFQFSQGSDQMKREDIKEALTALGAEVAYIDFKAGDPEGWVRLSKENAAKELAEKITDNKVKICDTDVLFKLLEGDEEKAYLDKSVDEMAKRRRNQKTFRQNKGKNFKGRQGRKRKMDNSDDAPPTKVTVAADS